MFVAKLAVARRRLVSLLGAFLLAAVAWSAPAQAHNRGFVLVDYDTGQILKSFNPDLQNHPASLTKMMTLYLLFDALEAGKVHLHDQMPVSVHAARQSPSKLGLNPGQTLRVDDAILALVTKSANDAAVVIAEHLGGSEAAFAAMMTKKARELGMRNTVFRNASGLPIAGQWSTPRDMSVLARALIRNHAAEYHYFATREFEFAGQVIATHNHLLGSYDGADGIKTGYIASAGFNLVASAKRDGHRLIGVVFGGDSVRDRDRQMVALLDAGFARLRGAGDTEMAKVDHLEQEPAGETVPATEAEAEAEDSQVTAVMQAMADSHPAAAQPSAPAALTSAHVQQQEAAAGDADDPPWGIQLGSFGKHDRAEKTAAAALRRLGDLAADGHVEVAPLRKRHAVLYRALLVGLAESDAQRACKALRHHHMACRVVRTDLSVAAR